MRRVLFVIIALSVGAAACSQAGTDSSTTAPTVPAEGSVASSTSPPPESTTTVEPRTLPPNDGQLRNQVGFVFPEPPAITNTGPLDPEVADDLETLWESFATSIDATAITRIGESGDPRLTWLLADLMRFIQSGENYEALLGAITSLSGVNFADDPVALRSPWQSLTDHLIAWDLESHPEYVGYKGRLFTIIEPAWQPFFDDADAEIDWRTTSWGGVRIDNRPLGDQLPCPQGCIPALDDPSVTDAVGGSWYPDERIVFGVIVNGEARAYPKHQMEVHEMVNDTLGGRRIGIPYCTLCGSAQAYFTDSVPENIETPVLRTSGLLTRSNKVMYDLNTFSIFDTFTGEALSGPLREADVALEQTTVVTSTWVAWRLAHPDTTIVAEDGGLDRRYSLDPLGGRDDNGPIFPIGDVDPRLEVQAEVIGVIAADGTAVAFAVDDLTRTLDSADSVTYEGLTITPSGGGFEASLADGTAVAAHQAFWFAWSQFHPETLLWTGDGG